MNNNDGEGSALAVITDADWSDGPDPITGCAYLIIHETSNVIECSSLPEDLVLWAFGKCHSTDSYASSLIPF